MILGKAGDKKPTPHLIAAYRREKNAETREAIVSAMGRIKDERALAVLKEAAANDPASQVRLYAEMAICLFEGTDYEDLRLKRREETNN